MAIVNRDLAISEKRAGPYQAFAALIGTGVTGIICSIPCPSVLDGCQVMAFGTSGAPTIQLVINRFIVGTGSTVFTVGGALAVAAFGTSGLGAAATFGVSLPQIGSTLLNLFTNDVIMYQTGGANSAMTGLTMDLAIRPIADHKTFYNIL